MELKKITETMYEALKKELPDAAVKPHPTKPYLSSIKAIFVTERLSDVFGCGAWQIRAEKVSENSDGMVVIKTTLSIPEYNVYYESYGGNDNGGQSNRNFDLGDAYKGATTDGITKIGSYLGIGIKVFKGEITNPDSNSSEPEPENWLNKFNKDKSIHQDYWTIVNHAKEKGYDVKELRKHYKISKTVAAELEKDLS